MPAKQELVQPAKSKSEEKLMKIMMDARTKNRYESVKLNRAVMGLEMQRHNVRVKLNGELFVNKSLAFKMNQAKVVKDTTSLDRKKADAADLIRKRKQRQLTLRRKIQEQLKETKTVPSIIVTDCTPPNSPRPPLPKILPSLYKTDTGGGGFLKREVKFDAELRGLTKPKFNRASEQRQKALGDRVNKSHQAVVLPLLSNLLVKGGMFTMPTKDDTFPSIRRRQLSPSLLLKRHMHNTFVGQAKRNMLEFGSCSKGHGRYTNMFQEDGPGRLEVPPLILPPVSKIYLGKLNEKLRQREVKYLSGGTSPRYACHKARSPTLPPLVEETENKGEKIPKIAH